VRVGRGTISQEFADSIETNKYDPIAPEEVKLARNPVGK